MAENVGGIVWTASIETQQLVNGERQINQSTNRAGRNFDNMERKATGLNTRLTQLAKTLAGVFAVRQIQRFTMETIRAVDEQNKFAQSISVSYQELQKLQFAAEQNGATINEFNNSLRRLARRTEEAARGTGAAVQAFENLGLNARELESLSPDQIFLRVADSFQALEGSGKEVSTAFGLFDTEGAKLINTLRQGSEGIRELGDEAERSGRIISQQTAEDAARFNDELNKLQGAAKGAAVSLGAELVPRMTELIAAATDWLATGDNVENLIRGIGVAAQATAAILAGRLVAAIAASTKAMISDTVATIANEKAKRGNALAAQQAAAAEVALLKSVQAGLVAQLQATNNTQMQAQIRARLAANTAALIKANTALTASQTRLNAVMRAGTVASRGLAGSLALLGGPVGIIAAAATAIFLLERNSRDLVDANKELALSVEEIAKEYEGLTKAKIADEIRAEKLELDALERRKEELELERDIAKEKAKNANQGRSGLAPGVGTMVSGLQESAEAARQLELVNAEIEERETRLKILNGEIETNTGNTEENTAATQRNREQSEESAKSITSLAERNEELRAVLSDTSDELEVRRALQAAGVEAGTAEAEVIEALIRGNQGLANAIRERAEAEQRRQELEGVAASDLGLTRLQALKQRYDEEAQLLLAAQEAGIESEVSYQERLNEIQRQYAEERKQIIADETETWKDRLNEVGFNLEALGSQGIGAIAGVAAGFQSGSDAARQFSQSVLQTAIGALIKLAIQGSILKKKEVAEAAIMGPAIATAYTPAAIAVNIASLGGAALAAAATAPLAAAATTAAITLGGARQYGGPVESGKAYRVNETEPEMFMAGGHQYLMPNMRGEVMNSKQVGGGDVNVSIRVNNNAPGVDVGVRQQGSGNDRQFILDVVKADITGYGQHTVGALTTVTNIKRKTQ